MVFFSRMPSSHYPANTLALLHDSLAVQWGREVPYAVPCPLPLPSKNEHARGCVAGKGKRQNCGKGHGTWQMLCSKERGRIGNPARQCGVPGLPT